MQKRNKPLIAIIGGTGKTGSQFAKFFRKTGHKVLVAGRETRPGIDHAASTGDVVIVSVPIQVAPGVIERVAPLVKKDGLLMDFTSIKGPACEAMRKSNGEAIGAHPLFGPGVKTLKGQRIMVCKVKGKKWFPWLKKFLEGEGAKILVCSPEEHDKRVALTQVLTHFHSMVLGKTMKDLGLDVKKSMKFSTPLYRIKLATLRILERDPLLYSGIMLENKEAVNTLKAFIKAAQELEKIIEAKDEKAFTEYFKKTGKHIGAYKQTFSKEADRLTEVLYKE